MGVNSNFERSQRWSFADGCALVDGLQSCHNGAVSSTRTGLAVGAGFEYAIAGSWLLRAEYLYLGFGGGTNLVTTNTGTNVANQFITHELGVQHQHCSSWPELQVRWLG